MLRHACGYALANKGLDTRTLQAYLGHQSINSTTRYAALALGGSKTSGGALAAPSARSTGLELIQLFAIAAHIPVAAAAQGAPDQGGPGQPRRDHDPDRFPSRPSSVRALRPAVVVDRVRDRYVYVRRAKGGRELTEPSFSAAVLPLFETRSNSTTCPSRPSWPTKLHKSS